jgi:hypothetical protein
VPSSAKNVGAYRVTSGGNLSLYCGDFFKLPPAPQFTRVWDRASLVALDPPTRVKYVETITKALAPGGVILLQTLHRAAGPPDSLAGGPPFSVSDDDVRALYARCARGSGSSSERRTMHALLTRHRVVRVLLRASALRAARMTSRSWTART